MLVASIVAIGLVAIVAATSVWLGIMPVRGSYRFFLVFSLTILFMTLLVSLFQEYAFYEDYRPPHPTRQSGRIAGQ
jgi:fatty acid desaturase